MQTMESGWNRVSRLAGSLALIGAMAVSSGASAQNDPGKATLAVRGFVATPAVEQAARADGSVNALQQILQAAEAQMEDVIQRGRKFQIVARKDLGTILKEQDLADSGLVNRLDPNTARSLNLAGARYIAMLTVDGFQDITDKTTFEDQLGETRAERRSIQLSGVAKIFDTTSGAMLASTPIKINENQLDKIIPGVQRDGRKTDGLLAGVSTTLARDVALSITDAVFPAKVLSNELGTVSFNRTAANGVAPGQIWEVMATGTELIDPDTGESLGRSEISIGWCEVVESGARFSRARTLVDNGIARGAVMRLRPAGMPEGLQGSGGAVNGGAVSGGRTAPSGGTAVDRGGSGASPGTRVAPQGERIDAGGGGVAPGTTAAPLKLAIFVKNISPDVPEGSTAQLQSAITSCLTASNVSVISRADIINGVARFAGRSADSGGGDPESVIVERALSDQASARNLAALLGADGFVVATINKLTSGTRSFKDDDLGVESSIREYDLALALRVVDGRTGGSVLGTLVNVGTSLRSTPNLEVTTDPIPDLIEKSARSTCSRLGPQIERLQMPGAEAVADAMIQIDLVASGLEVPDIQMRSDGQLVVGGTMLPLQPTGANVLVDGVLTSTLPGEVSMTPGIHRLRIDHPFFESIEQVINVTGTGQSFNFAMQLSDEGRASWAKNIEIIESMKNGEVLRQNQVEMVKAFAQFLASSRINLDTSEVRNLNLGEGSYWWQILGE